MEILKMGNICKYWFKGRFQAPKELINKLIEFDLNNDHTSNMFEYETTVMYDNYKSNECDHDQNI